MTIQCDTLENFLDTIEGLVKRGLTFQSSTASYTIVLLGGY
jgi:hypothetical protein